LTKRQRSRRNAFHSFARSRRVGERNFPGFRLQTRFNIGDEFDPTGQAGNGVAGGALNGGTPRALSVTKMFSALVREGRGSRRELIAPTPTATRAPPDLRRNADSDRTCRLAARAIFPGFFGGRRDTALPWQRAIRWREGAPAHPGTSNWWRARFGPRSPAPGFSAEYFSMVHGRNTTRAFGSCATQRSRAVGFTVRLASGPGAIRPAAPAIADSGIC